LNEFECVAQRKEAITVVVADDHPMVRRGLVAILGGEPDFKVLGEAATGSEALDRTRTFRPDILVMDVNMPECDSETARRIREECPGTRIVVFSFWNDAAAVDGFKCAGASAYVVKGSSGKALIELLRAVVTGGSFRLLEEIY